MALNGNKRGVKLAKLRTSKPIPLPNRFIAMSIIIFNDLIFINLFVIFIKKTITYKPFHAVFGNSLLFYFFPLRVKHWQVKCDFN